MNRETDKRRKYPRHKAPKGLFVGWKSAGQRTVSLAETISLGGLFLHTPDPPSEGSVIELLFDLKAGEVRARALVRHSMPGKGMGVQFIQMQSADRGRLNQFLSRYIATQPPQGNKTRNGESGSPASSGKDAAAAKSSAAVEFERELHKVLDFARTGTHYQLLGVTPDSAAKDIRQSFYGLARKFHPDYHMGNPQWMAPLKELMAAATSAYKVLMDEQQRARYDARLASSGAHTLRRAKTASQESLEQCFARANEYIRAGNFVGSIVWLRKCTEIAPDAARYHSLLARSLSEVPQFQNEAIGEFRRAIELDAWNIEPYMQLAELYESMHTPSRAKALYSKVLDINPLHAQAKERLLELDAESTEIRP